MNPFRLATRRRPPPRAGPPLGSLVREHEGSPVPVPWRVTLRSPSGVIEVEYRGGAPARHVRFALAGYGLLGLSLPQTVGPGERVRVTLRGAHTEGAVAAPDAMLVLRWFEADGTELLWPIAL